MPWFSLGDVDPEDLKRMMEEARKQMRQMFSQTFKEMLDDSSPALTPDPFQRICKPKVDKRRSAEIDGGE